MIRRSTTQVHVVAIWPGEGPEWDALSKDTRNAIRNHMDAICDIIELHLP